MTTTENSMSQIQFEAFEVNFNDSSTSVNTGYAILQTIFCVILLPTSLTLIFGIVYYEHFGVDSQKRSFYNRSISALFATLGLNEIFIFVPVSLSPYAVGQVLWVTVWAWLLPCPGDSS